MTNIFVAEQVAAVRSCRVPQQAVGWNVLQLGRGGGGLPATGNGGGRVHRVRQHGRLHQCSSNQVQRLSCPRHPLHIPAAVIVSSQAYTF